MISIFIIILAVLYLLLSLFLFIGIMKTRNRTCATSPTVTVIVAARNEAKHIQKCLFSLAELTYPADKLEIIIVNDRSEDETGAIIANFIQKYPLFKYIEITEDHPFLSGKAGALSTAIEQCSGELIFITDADCIVPHTWLQHTVPYFLDDVGIVAGFTVIKSMPSRFSVFEKIQALDWLYLLTVAAGATGWSMPVSCVGNNFAFRKKVYHQIGGYEGVGFSLTEDFALLNAIDSKTTFRTIFLIHPDSLVLSQPLENIHSFFKQRIRWATGGPKVRLLGKLLISLGLATHISLVLSPFITTTMIAILTSILLITCSDLVLIYYSCKFLNLTSLVLFYPIFKIFYTCYLLIIPLLTFVKRHVTWKNVSYPVLKK